jgi:hypothetical protein
MESLVSLRRIGRKLWRYPIDIVRWHLDASFDRRHGIDAFGKLSLAGLKINSPHVSRLP